VALNLRDIDISDLKRGMALAAPGHLAPSDWLTISLRAVAGAPPLKNGMRLRALLGTDEFDARLRLLDRDVLEPGESGFAQLHCAVPVALPAREHVVLRLASPSQTVAGGRILDPATRRQRRHSPPLLQRLAALHRLDGEGLIFAELEGQGAAGTSLSRLSQLSALAPARIAALLKPHPVLVTGTGLVVRHADLDGLAARIPALLAPHTDGLAPGKLLAALPGTGAKLLDEAITLLLSRNAISKRGAQLVLPRPEQDQARAQDEAAWAAEIADLLQASNLSPPDPKTIVTSLAAKRAVDRLLREGLVIRAVDRAKDKEILFHHEAVEHAMRLLAPLLEQPPGLLATDVCAALGITRKYAMPLLDHLDTIRFTRRINDRRIRGTASLATLLSTIQNV
jgi:selenocysteine-specific elongation factor